MISRSSRRWLSKVVLTKASELTRLFNLLWMKLLHENVFFSLSLSIYLSLSVCIYLCARLSLYFLQRYYYSWKRRVNITDKLEPFCNKYIPYKDFKVQINSFYFRPEFVSCPGRPGLEWTSWPPGQEQPSVNVIKLFCSSLRHWTNKPGLFVLKPFQFGQIFDRKARSLCFQSRLWPYS